MRIYQVQVTYNGTGTQLQGIDKERVLDESFRLFVEVSCRQDMQQADVVQIRWSEWEI